MSPSNGKVSHSSTGGIRSDPATRSQSCSGDSAMRPTILPAWSGQTSSTRSAAARTARCAPRGGRTRATAIARIFAGEVSDAYLNRNDIQRGYTIVTWRGRHVAEPTELEPDEAAAYWLRGAARRRGDRAAPRAP